MVSELGEAEDEIFKRRRDTDVSQTETVVGRTRFNGGGSVVLLLRLFPLGGVSGPNS